MAFTIIGPGIQDPVKLDKLFDRYSIEKTGKISPKRPNEPDRPRESWEDYAHLLVKRKTQKAFNIYTEIENIHEEIPAIFAQHIMTPAVLTMNEKTTIGDAIKIFHDNKFRHIPVLTSKGKVLGMISDRDVLHAISGLTADYRQQGASLEKDINIKRIMDSPVLTAGLNTDIRLIARLFVEFHIGAVPVMAGEKISGIITSSDILQAVMRHYALELWA